MKSIKIIAALLLLTACNNDVERLSCSDPMVRRQYYQLGRNKCFYVDSTGSRNFVAMDKCKC